MSGFMLETKLGAAMVDLTVGPDTKSNESLVTRLSPALEKFGIAPKCIILLIVDGANYKLSSLLEKIKTLEHVIVIRCQAHGLSLCFEYMAGYKIRGMVKQMAKCFGCLKCFLLPSGCRAGCAIIIGPAIFTEKS